MIYEEFLTNALFEKLKDLLRGRVLYLAMEKRINFALDGLEWRVYSRCYNHFMLHLTAEEPTFDPITGIRIPKSVFSFKRIPIGFTQYFDYERVDELHLWEIRLKSTTDS